MKKPLPSQKLLNQLLDYIPETGELFWKTRPVSLFSGKGEAQKTNARIWNSRYAGKQALPCKDPKGTRGYSQANILGEKYLTHRVIWKMMTGDEPDEIDHDDGIKTNNSWVNLKASDSLLNKKNLSVNSRNTSGYTGVCWHDAAGKWWATITVNKQTKSLGLFESKAKAIDVRMAAEKEHGFHPNHGRRRKPKGMK